MKLCAQLGFLACSVALAAAFAPLMVPTRLDKSTTRLQMVDLASNELILPGILFLSAAAASLYTDKNPEGLKDFTVKVEKAVEEVQEKVDEAKSEQVKPKAKETKSTTDLVKQVASTVDEQRKTKKLVESRKASKAKDEPAAEPEEEEVEAPKSGKKRRLIVRVMKKVVAPWRKWENIK